MNNQNVIEKIILCVRTCGGITGKYMAECADDVIAQKLLEDGVLRKIPVLIKSLNKTIYLFEDFEKHKPIQFPNMTEIEARRIAALNKCFFEHVDEFTNWFSQSEINVFTEDVKKEKNYLVPDMMCYVNEKLVAIYVKPEAAPLSNSDREILKTKLLVDQVMEYLY